MHNQFMLVDRQSGGFPHLRIPRPKSGAVVRVSKNDRQPIHRAGVVIIETNESKSEIVLLQSKDGQFFLPEFHVGRYEERDMMVRARRYTEELFSLNLPSVEQLYHQPLGGSSWTAYLATRVVGGRFDRKIDCMIGRQMMVGRYRLSPRICDGVFKPHRGPIQAALHKLREDPHFTAVNSQFFGVMDARKG